MVLAVAVGRCQGSGALDVTWFAAYTLIRLAYPTSKTAGFGGGFSQQRAKIAAFLER